MDAISRRRIWRTFILRSGNLSEEQRRRRGSQDAATSGHRSFTRRPSSFPAPVVKVDVRETPHTTWARPGEDCERPGRQPVRRFLSHPFSGLEWPSVGRRGTGDSGPQCGHIILSGPTFGRSGFLVSFVHSVRYAWSALRWPLWPPLKWVPSGGR